jgi:hypothetical protein
MRQDEYGAAIEAALKTATEPMSASELREAVGCSRQRVYAWLSANEHRLRPAGKDRQGAILYTWAGRAAAGSPAGEGTTLGIRSFFVDEGEIVLVLVGPDGSTYHARPAPL